MIGTDIAEAVRLLRAGQLVAIPTETVYGLAGNTLDEKAVSHIFAVKNRPRFDPVIIHLPVVEHIFTYVTAFPEPLRKLAGHFMPGPLTLLLPRKAIIPDLVTAGASLVAVRIPRHPLTQQLLQEIDFPLAAPSANPFGYISPTRAEHVDRQLGDQVPYILDGGPCAVGLESTIVGMENGVPTVFRKGGVAVEALEAIAGPIQVKAQSTSNPRAPGMLQSHYAPRVPLVMGALETLLPRYAGRRIGLLRFQAGPALAKAEKELVLSPGGNLEEAARRLFAHLRELDELSLDIILAEPAPETGLGRAINDRLRRASAATPSI